jgi:hypothetical protein
MTTSITNPTFSIEEKQLLSTDRRSRRWIPVKHYQKVYDFIMNELATKNEISLCALLDEAAAKIRTSLPPNYTWILLQVKDDMEARSIIQTAIETGVRTIRLRRVTGF